MKITLIRHTQVAVKPGICYGQTDVETAPGFTGEAATVRKTLPTKHSMPYFAVPCRAVVNWPLIAVFLLR